MVNGEIFNLTAEEETARDAEEQAWSDGAPARAVKRVQTYRRAAYERESDPIFFKEQRGEVEVGTWAAAIAAIKAANPKP